MTGLTIEQRLQMLIGSYTFQITSQQVEIEQLKARIAELKPAPEAAAKTD